MDTKKLKMRIVEKDEEGRFKRLLTRHHYLGSVPKIGKTLWYVATIDDEWVALASFSVSALKVECRDRWIGWDYRRQNGRLKLVVNNNRFLILPRPRSPNLGSRVLSSLLRRLSDDWVVRFGHRVCLVETFVDPKRFAGAVYKASNWRYIGDTKGYARSNGTYERTGERKMVFVRELGRDARRILSQPILREELGIGEVKTSMKAEHMRALPDFFSNVRDPRRAEGKRHRLKTVLSIATAAVLCGAKGYKGVSEWANALGQKARERFNCRRSGGKNQVPSESTIRNVLTKVDPDEIDESFRNWNEVYAIEDESLAIDGKTMCNAIDDNGRQVHVMSVVGHDSGVCRAQKKSVRYLRETTRRS